MNLNDRQKAVLKATFKSGMLEENDYHINFETAKGVGASGQTMAALVRKGIFLPRRDNSWFWHLTAEGLAEREKLLNESD